MMTDVTRVTSFQIQRQNHHIWHHPIRLSTFWLQELFTAWANTLCISIIRSTYQRKLKQTTYSQKVFMQCATKQQKTTATY